MEINWIDLLSLIVAILSLIVAAGALFYSIKSNTKKFELSYQHFSDIVSWHDQIVEVLLNLRSFYENEEIKKDNLLKLSVLIDHGRFYFPNVNRKNGYGIKKPLAYRGYRNIILDCLVEEYKILENYNPNEDYECSLKLQKTFTSYIFEYLNPDELKNKREYYTYISKKNDK